MSLNRQKTGVIILILILVTSLNCMSQKPCTWNPEKKELQFSLSELSGILNCDSKSGHGKSHHFNKVIHKPSGTMISPDGALMAGTGMLNFFRVLI